MTFLSPGPDGADWPARSRAPRENSAKVIPSKAPNPEIKRESRSLVTGLALPVGVTAAVDSWPRRSRVRHLPGLSKLAHRPRLTQADLCMKFCWRRPQAEPTAAARVSGLC